MGMSLHVYLHKLSNICVYAGKLINIRGLICVVGAAAYSRPPK